MQIPAEPWMYKDLGEMSDQEFDHYCDIMYMRYQCSRIFIPLRHARRRALARMARREFLRNPIGFTMRAILKLFARGLDAFPRRRSISRRSARKLFYW